MDYRLKTTLFIALNYANKSESFYLRNETNPKCNTPPIAHFINYASRALSSSSS